MALIGWRTEFGTGHILHSLPLGRASMDVLPKFSPQVCSIFAFYMSLGTQYATAVYTCVLEF